MISLQRRGQIFVSSAVGIAAIFSIVSAAIWKLAPQPLTATSSWADSQSLNIPYTEMRTQLVRDCFMEKFMNRCECTVIEDKILERKIDLSNDRRPLMNALKRRSKSTVHQKHQITIELDHETLGSRTVQILQDVHISPEETRIHASLVTPLPKLKSYVFEIRAFPMEEQTKLDFNADIVFAESISSLFQPIYEQRVETEFDHAMAKQVSAFMSTFEPLE